MDQTIKAIIVDDDPYFLFYLKALLGKNSNVHILKTFNNGNDFLDYLNLGYVFDVAFLDIRLPDVKGNKIGRIVKMKSPNTQVVFITGDTGHAVEAFELEASDYLVKPFNLERLERCLNKIALRIEYLKTHSKTYVIKNKQRIINLNLKDIVFIEKYKKRVLFHTKNNTYECSDKLRDVENRINDKNFIRSHKSYIINTDYIKSIEKWADRAYQIIFYGTNKKALLSRSHSEKVLDRTSYR